MTDVYGGQELTPEQREALAGIAAVVDVAPIFGPDAADDEEQIERLEASSEDAARRRLGSLADAAKFALDRTCAFFPLTDLGNARRFVRRNQNRFRHVPELGWIAWDGVRWSRHDAAMHLMQAVYDTVVAIQDEAEVVRGTDEDLVLQAKADGQPVTVSDKIASWGRSSESAAKIAAIPKLAEALLSLSSDKLDADPWRISVLNGTLVIDRSGGDGDVVKFRKHDPLDYITKLAPVVYDADARCPNYDRFLAEVQPDGDQRRFLHQWGGYSLTGDTSEQKLVFFYGKGKNGKSTLVDAWGGVAGDYGEAVPIETFLNQGRGRNAGQATPDLAILPGVRMLRTSEPEKGAKLAEALIKLVTGGEPIQARHLNRDYFKFRPAFKLTMSGNYRPSIDGTDEGIWRRVVLVPWLVTVEKADRELPAKLDRERSGILNRLLDGLRDYVDNGLVVPETVLDATASYRDDSDPLGRFLRLAVEMAPGERVQSTILHRAFVAWAKAVGEREWSPKGLAQAMKDRNFRSKQSNVMWWLDVRLSADGEALDVHAAPHPSEVVDEG